MAYQVIKRVGNRAYRYEVTSYRDAASGRSKGTWTYLGRCDDPADAAAPSVVPTRERLLDAFAALLAEASYGETTIAAVAKRAGVTAATYYRHFKDKRALFFALVERTRDQLNPASVFQVSGDRNAERARIKAFVRSVAAHPTIRAGIARAILEMQCKDPAIDRFWQHFVRYREGIWREYIAELNAAGLGHGDDPATMAAVLTMFTEGIRQVVALRSEKLPDKELELVGEVIARVLIR